MNEIENATDGIESTVDRGEVDLRTKDKQKRNVIIFLIVIVVMLIVAVGLGFTLYSLNTSAMGSEQEQFELDDGGIIKGESDIGNESFLTQIRQRAQLEQKQAEAEAARQKAAEEAAAKAETEKEVAEANIEPEKPVLEYRTEPRVRSREPLPQSQSQPQPVATAANSSSSEPKPLTKEERQMQGSVMVNASGSDVAYGGGGDSLSDGNSPIAQRYDNSYNGSSFESGSATVRPPRSLDFLLKHGTSIPCALQTEIISEYNGYVICRTTQDIYSANGNALLIERGSTITGQQNVALEQGKARLFVIWSNVETPNGVSVRIDSLGTGSLGAAGVDVWVDYHYAKRFGGALLLSFIEDGLDVLNSNLKDNHPDTSFDNSTQSMDSLANEVLKHTINIPPTGYALVGSRLNILVVRDIDMSNVYKFQ
ncbi:type IV secretion system protein VirB10 [Thaumasiovibrio subtropicus]|uniref:type IV secretion system protein VirB10 n=1 Tax=Thaumasiovibrio subtropicus TaxID=1891207 RepID=UPI000B3598D2|nr:type IV secretion system protein VirB10 [Thaumasiovibrio subtropicus]